MPDHPTVFISCARDDVQRASEISEALNRNGTLAVTDWANVHPGGDWIAELESTLDDCDVFVPLVSKEFLASEFATYELGFATHKQAMGSIRIIPVILDEVDGMPLPGLLRRFPVLDGRGKQGLEIADAVLAELKRVGTGLDLMAGSGSHTVVLDSGGDTLMVGTGTDNITLAAGHTISASSTASNTLVLGTGADTIGLSETSGNTSLASTGAMGHPSR